MNRPTKPDNLQTQLQSIQDGVPANRLPTQWVLATQNAGKIREFGEALQAEGIELSPLSHWTNASPEETGLSFVENALIKARHASSVSGLPALADDSGLVVDALGGAPGILSARFAGPTASDQDNLAYLLESLQRVPESKRSAHFICVLAWMRHPQDPCPLIALGRWSGRVLEAPCGTQGFGYDPIFWVPERQCSAAELSPETKRALSHRGQALDHLLTQLKSLND